MILHGFEDELLKISVDLSRLGDETREKVTFNVGMKTGRDFARGAMRRVGLDPDDPGDKALAVAGVSAPAGAMAISGMRDKSRLRRLEKQMAKRQIVREARRAQRGKKVREVLRRIVRKGR